MKNLLAVVLLVASSAFAQTPDLVIKSVELIDAATGAPTRTGLFGGTGRMRVTAANEGTDAARDFKIGIALSVDTSFLFQADFLVLDYPVALLAQGATATYDIPFTIPDNELGVPFASGNYYWFAVLDSVLKLNELKEFNNHAAAAFPGPPAAILMSAPGPDLTVTRVDAPSTVGVGELAPVHRVFKNVGSRPAANVKYRFYVSANSAVTTADTPLKIVTATGAMIDFRMLELTAPPDPTSTQAETELVAIPATLTPGTWYLGAVVDTDGTVVEIDEANNGLSSMPVTVAGPALRITTSQLPDAMAGRPYSFQLAVTGDVPSMPTTWVVDAAQGQLPEGLELSATTGLLSGTPLAEAVVGITVTATNNRRVAVARLVLRVLPTTTQVEITSASLPPVVNSPLVTYEAWLGAAGGVKPYTWRVVPTAGEVLPLDIRLASNGRLSGVPRQNTIEKVYPVTFEVKDWLGSVATRQLSLRVISNGAIRFTNLAIPDGLVGEAYLTDIPVRSVEGSPPPAKPLTYRIAAGKLPDGISMTVEQDALLLQGTPKQAGAFAFTLEVEDNGGRSDSADFLLRVYQRGLDVDASGLPVQLRPGDPVDFGFVVEGKTGVTFKLFSGVLPPGTALSADGRVTGAVANENAEGTYNFVIEATDATGATGLGAFTVAVRRDVPKQGCSAAPMGLMMLAALALTVRRRRQLRRG